MGSLAARLAIPPSVLDEINRFLLDPANPLVKALLDVVAKYGTPEENPSFWAEISANTYVRDLSGPVQLHHGTADTSVPVEFSEILFEQITAAGGEVELYTYEGDNHNVSNSFKVAMQRSLEFFDAHLR